MQHHSEFRDLILVLRPFQWVKNFVILVPLFLAPEFFNTEKFIDVLIGVVSFSFLTSAVYIFNDLYDRERGIAKMDPIAVGQFGRGEALGLVAILVILTGFIVRTYIPVVFPIYAGYALLSVMYILYLRYIAIVDVVVVSLFYVIRILVGGIIAGLLISEWLILCTFFATLFVSIGKRRAEIVVDPSIDTVSPVSRMYSVAFLDQAILLCAGALIMSYTMYTILGLVIPYFVFSNLIVTIGILRYLYVIQQTQVLGASEQRLFGDPVIQLSILSWVCYVAVVFYF